MKLMTIKMNVLVAVSIAGAVLGLSGCKLKKNEVTNAKASGQIEIFFDFVGLQCGQGRIGHMVAEDRAVHA